MTTSNSRPILRAAVGRWPWLALTVVGVAAVVLAIRAFGPGSSAPPGQRWGVDQLRIHRTAQGHLLDFRYHVVDADRAASLLATQTPAYLVHERTGRRLAVPSMPKAGAMRNTGQAKVGRDYFALFNNPGGLVRTGDRVSVVLGELKAELTVQ
jgi:hypothetical protein